MLSFFFCFLLLLLWDLEVFFVAQTWLLVKKQNLPEKSKFFHQNQIQSFVSSPVGMIDIIVQIKTRRKNCSYSWCRKKIENYFFGRCDIYNDLRDIYSEPLSFFVTVLTSLQYDVMFRIYQLHMYVYQCKPVWRRLRTVNFIYVWQNGGSAFDIKLFYLKSLALKKKLVSLVFSINMFYLISPTAAA